MFAGSMISRLYFVMFSTFWLLYLLSYVPEYYDKEKAESIYAKVMIVSVIFGLIFAPLWGKLVDTASPRIVIPLAYFTRGISVVFFFFSNDPTSWYSFFCGVLMVIGTCFE